MDARAAEIEPKPRRTRKWPAGLGGRSEKSTAQLLITPGQLLMLFLVLFPAGVAIYLSFTDYEPSSGYLWYDAYKGWIWFQNYWDALTSSAAPLLGRRRLLDGDLPHRRRHGARRLASSSQSDSRSRCSS